MKRLMIAATLSVGIGIFLGVLLVSNISPENLTNLFANENTVIGTEAAPVSPTEQSLALNKAMVEVSDAVIPTVVFINVETEVKFDEDELEQMPEFFRFFAPEERGSEGQGSGVVISEDGYIVTNNHVVENATNKGITVTMNDKKVYQAKLVGTDPLTDLAVIKIEPDQPLKAAHFGEIEDVQIGQLAFAVGNPLGLNSTMTMGIISAIGRGQLGGRSSAYSVENYIQTDAAINPGNSGGGLYNINGSLIGINTAIATRTGTYIGYGFAIPIDLVKSVIDDLIEDGRINRGYIGVQIRSLRDDVEAKGFELDEVTGALVTNVVEGGAAEKANVMTGDIILEVNGKKINSSNELQGTIVLYRAGDTVDLTIWRDGEEIYKKVTLQANEEEEQVVFNEEPEEENDSDEPVKFDDLGFSISPLTNEIEKQFEIDYGVYVTDVERYSHASDRGLFPRGVIFMAGKEKVNSTGELKDIIASSAPGDILLLHVKYNETNQIVALEIPG